MDNPFQEHYSLLTDSAERFLSENYSFTDRQKIISQDPGYRAEHWQQTVELGWTCLCVPPEYGGLGADARFVAQLTRQFGKHIFLSPLFASGVVSSKIIELTARDSQRQAMLEQIAQGHSIITTALYEPQSRYDLHNIATLAARDRNLYTINGSKVAVQYGSCATHIVVLARTEGEQSDTWGLTLFCIPATAEGLHFKHYVGHDGSRVSTLELNHVSVDSSCMLGSVNEAALPLQRAINFSVSAICAEMTGAMEFLLDTTLDYVKTRSQFGRKLSEFQTIQHRLVDMYARCEMANSLSQEAARAVDTLSELEQNLIISAAKHEIGQMAIFNAEEAVHLHGAMGMMDELPIGHYLKRLFCLNLAFGDCDYHKTRYRELSKIQYDNA